MKWSDNEVVRLLFYSIKPSFKRITRSVIAAISFSCVTTTRVIPWSCTFLNIFITSSEVVESNAPVGSSARITFGCPINALAMQLAVVGHPTFEWVNALPNLLSLPYPNTLRLWLVALFWVFFDNTMAGLHSL